MADDGPVTINDVARRAGVAVSSVSRVLGNHPDVSDAMRARVERAARELGYEPNPIARSLRSGSSKQIGYVVRDLLTPFFSEVIEGMDAVLDQHGYTLLVLQGGGDHDREIDRIALLRHHRVDGLFLSTVVDSTAKLRRAVGSFGRPVVLVDRDLPGVDAGTAVFDHALGVAEATRDLVSLGHSRIAFVTGNEDVRPTRERLRGFRSGLAPSECAQRDSVAVSGAFSVSFAKARTAELLARPLGTRPTALLTGGVQATIGALEAVSESGARLGQDLALVVVDDLAWLRVLRPQISAVARDATMMGRIAASLMLSQLAGEEAATVTLATTYERRETTTEVPQSG